MTTSKRKASLSPDRDWDVPKPFISHPSSPSLLSSCTTDPALLLSFDRPHTSPARWCDFRHIFVFGDSYSSDTTTNWIGHLQKYVCSPEGPPLVHNFSTAGDTVEDDLSSQLGCLFRKIPKVESLENGDRTLFVIWMGINDCGRTDADELEPIVEQIFDAMHDLYVKWKAKTFLLIDVPPMQRSPGGISINIDAERYDTWNEQLLKQAETFSHSASNASVFVVSAHYIISNILDHPEDYGFLNFSGDSTARNACNASVGRSELSDGHNDESQEIWEDSIHLSSAAHQVVADRLLKIFE